MEPTVSIICVCHDNRKWFERYFQSIHGQTILDRLEIIMVDNLSSDGSPEILIREVSAFPYGVFVQTGGDHGYGVGCNHGAARARGKYLFFVNPDIWFEADCLGVTILTCRKFHDKSHPHRISIQWRTTKRCRL